MAVKNTNAKNKKKNTKKKYAKKRSVGFFEGLWLSFKDLFRKKTYWEQIQRDIKRNRKKSRKLNRKFLALPVKKKEQLYKKLLRSPKFFELMIQVIAILVVFVIFYKKAKDPDFLSDL